MSNNTPQKIAIIDLGAGNLRSVHKAVERAAHDGEIPADISVTTNKKEVEQADRIVLPGVGAFKACMDGLNNLTGIREALEQAVYAQGKPLLGICVGMQMLADEGHEFGVTPGLGWIPGRVTKLEPTAMRLRVPHMGWNQINATQAHTVFGAENTLSGEDFYFLHSYHFETGLNDHTLAVCEYGSPVVAAVVKNNIVGVQFHPEKSQGAGLALLQNFLTWQPESNAT